MDQLPNTPASSAQPSSQPGSRMPIPRVNPQAPAPQSYVDMYSQQAQGQTVTQERGQMQDQTPVQGSLQQNQGQSQNQGESQRSAESQNQQPQPVQTNQSQANTNQPNTGMLDDQLDPAFAQNQIFPEYLRPQQEYLLFEWEANSRPFKKHNRQYFTTIATIALLVCLILFFSGQFLPIAVVIAVAFVVYVMATIPPHKVNHQITTFGIRIENALYYWEEMGRFWFTKKFDDALLHVEVARFPERLSLVLGDTDMALIREILSEVLLEEKPLPTYYERMAGWLQEKFPLDM